MANFIFKNRETKEVVYTAEITADELEQDYNNDLTQVFSEYNAQTHTVEYTS